MFSYIDAHTHISNLTMENMYSMYLAGIRTVVSPVQLGCGRSLYPETIIDVWYGQLEKQFKRCKTAQIKPYAMLGISMVATPSQGLDMLCEKLEELMAREDVVAIGEVGFEPGSASNSDHEFQKTLLTRQIEIAKRCGKVLDVHTPNAPDKKIAATEETLSLCAAAGIPMDKVVIDHCTIDNLNIVLAAGANAAISVQPWRNVTPNIAAGWLTEFDTSRIMLDSDCSELDSDPLAVAKTAAVLSKRNVSQDIIDAVCGGNARRIYSLEHLSV